LASSRPKQNIPGITAQNACDIKLLKFWSSKTSKIFDRKGVNPCITVLRSENSTLANVELIL
jgi:hypothetical protein